MYQNNRKNFFIKYISLNHNNFFLIQEYNNIFKIKIFIFRYV